MFTPFGFPFTPTCRSNTRARIGVIQTSTPLNGCIIARSLSITHLSCSYTCFSKTRRDPWTVQDLLFFLLLLLYTIFIIYQIYYIPYLLYTIFIIYHIYYIPYLLYTIFIICYIPYLLSTIFIICYIPYLLYTISIQHFFHTLEYVQKCFTILRA